MRYQIKLTLLKYLLYFHFYNGLNKTRTYGRTKYTGIEIRAKITQARTDFIYLIH